MAERGVVFLPSYYEAIKGLPAQDRLAAYDAIVSYGLYGEIIELDPPVRSLFILIKPIIDTSIKRWEAAKENGSKPPKEGANPRGRPRKNQLENQSEYQDKDIDTENDIEKNMDTENDSAENKEGDTERKIVRGGEKTVPCVNPCKPLSLDEFEEKRQERVNMLSPDFWERY